ncbi:FtsK/SpoIIIE domain-containing protein [Alkalihalobacillus sp. NPDC078783]
MFSRKYYTYKFDWNDFQSSINEEVIEMTNIKYYTLISRAEIDHYISKPVLELNLTLESLPDLSYRPCRSVKVDRGYLYPFNFKLIYGAFQSLQDYLTFQEEIVIKLTLQKDFGWRNKVIEEYKELLQPNTPKLTKQFKNFFSSDPIIIPSAANSRMQSLIFDERYTFNLDFYFLRVDENKEKLISNYIQSILSQYSYLNSMHLTQAPYRPFKQHLSQGDIIGLFDVERPVIDNLVSRNDMCLSNTPPNSLIELLETEEVEVEDNSKELTKAIKQALVDVKVFDKLNKIQVLSSFNGSLFHETVIKLPRDISLTTIIHKNIKENMQSVLGVKGLSIEQGEEANTVSILMPLVNRTPIYLKNILLGSDIINNDDYILPFCAGVDPKGNSIIDCLTRMKHLLVAGQTGGGKSEWLNQFLTTLLLIKDKKDLQVNIIDPKMVEFIHYEGFPQVKNIITDMDLAENYLISLIREMKERYKQLKSKSCKNIKQYREKGFDMPYIVLIVDEYADLKASVSNLNDKIQNIAQMGRAAGIHMVIATQRPDAKIIDGVIKASLPSKISFRLDNNSSYKTVFGEGVPYHLLGMGHGVMKREGEMGYEQFQGAIISLNENETERIITNIRKQIVSGKATTSEISNVNSEVSKLDQAKKIIATSGEAKVSLIQEKLKIRRSSVIDLMQKLIDEDWLQKSDNKQKGYTVIADEEDLDKWRA